MLRSRGRGARAGGGGARRVAARDLEEAGRPAGSGGSRGRPAGGGGAGTHGCAFPARVASVSWGSAEAATAPSRSCRVSGVRATPGSLSQPSGCFPEPCCGHGS